MEVVVGKLAGFCGGVINSIKKSESILDDFGSTYCLGELVHNKQVVAKLEEKGLKVVNSLDDIEKNERVIIRAHGVPKDVYEVALQRNIQLIDLTCPKVLKIHDEAGKLKEDGYFIVLIAQEVHPEAIGTISFCGNDSAVLEQNNQLDDVVGIIRNSNKKKVAVISQTTFSVAKFEELVSELKIRLSEYDLLINNTICEATELRQKETLEMAQNVDAMIIIGGKNSSNTKKLYEIAVKKCKNSFIIEVLDDLKEDMSNYSKVGVMAGASTPSESIHEVVEYLENL